MKIYGFFRGFPGLGRVMSGISILTSLKALGHEVKAYSYLQGLQALKDHHIECLPVAQPPLHQVMTIGLNPISKASQELIDLICREQPDLVIVDGEALFVSTLAMAYPREKILSLLNPTDVYNEDLPNLTMRFYHTHYFAAGLALVHGISKEQIIVPKDTLGCEVLSTNTILRQNVLRIKPQKIRHNLVAILGGGSKNAAENFIASTLRMARCIIEAARHAPAENFTLYCNDPALHEQLSAFDCPINLKVVSKYTLPEDIYTTAEVVICRAGRNTISELLYLNLPGVLMPSASNFRATEQSKNTQYACSLKAGRLLTLEQDEGYEALLDKIARVRQAGDNNFKFIPGNQPALEFILRKIQP